MSTIQTPVCVSSIQHWYLVYFVLFWTKTEKHLIFCQLRFWVFLLWLRYFLIFGSCKYSDWRPLIKADLCCLSPRKHEDEPGISGEGVQEPGFMAPSSADSEIVGDGFCWRKYGQKFVKGNPYSRLVFQTLEQYSNTVGHGLIIRKLLWSQKQLTKSVQSSSLTYLAPVKVGDVIRV